MIYLIIAAFLMVLTVVLIRKHRKSVESTSGGAGEEKAGDKNTPSEQAY